jgi:hypothetical protein
MLHEDDKRTARGKIVEDDMLKLESPLTPLSEGGSPQLVASAVSQPYLGLCTVYRIDGITVAVYGRRHRTVRVLSKFGPYPATAQLTPYPTIFYGRIRP